MPNVEHAVEQDAPIGRESTDMKEMASARKSMADMCRMMMQREMQFRPYLMAAGAVIGGFLLIALALFVVLEVQGIRFLGARIRTERQKLSSQPGK